ncbi:hypothetical protein APA_5242 [Pseudanabaena sp. lw0831]|nr:hypothetical protein APA_5242 [Pseudanabaena sp. lw0831]
MALRGRKKPLTRLDVKKLRLSFLAIQSISIAPNLNPSLLE